MARVPQGTKCVNSESPNGDLPTVLSPPAISRRSILGGLAAACGFAATTPQLPLKSVPVDLLDAIAQPVVERVPVAVSYSDKRPWQIAPSERHITDSFTWRNIKQQARSDEYSIGARDLEFFAGGRCYMPVCCSLDMCDDEPFRPDHWLDWPDVPTDYGGHQDGRLWDGLTIADYGSPDDIMLRHEAMRRVVDVNRATTDAEGWDLPSSTEWWIVLQMGAELTPGWIDPMMCAGVGKVQINLELACRIVTPTANEVAHFGKGGV